VTDERIDKEELISFFFSLPSLFHVDSQMAIDSLSRLFNPVPEFQAPSPFYYGPYGEIDKERGSSFPPFPFHEILNRPTLSLMPFPTAGYAPIFHFF